jgi:hypothetical protein
LTLPYTAGADDVAQAEMSSAPRTMAMSITVRSLRNIPPALAEI